MALHDDIQSLRARIEELERQLEDANVELERMRRLFSMDEETGAVHRSLFMSRLQEEIRAAERYGRFLTVVVVSVYPTREEPSLGGGSEQYGELTRSLCGRFSQMVRETDSISELDDHQVAIMLVEAEERNALQVVSRLKQEADRAMDVRWALASYPTDAPRDDLLVRIARERLQTAQRAMSGTVVSSSVILPAEEN